MTTDPTERILEKLNDFRVEVAGKLGRLEARVDANGDLLDELSATVEVLNIDHEVAKREGGKGGRIWGAGVAAAVVALAETVRAWFGQ